MIVRARYKRSHAIAFGVGFVGVMLGSTIFAYFQSPILLALGVSGLVVATAGAVADLRYRCLEVSPTAIRDVRLPRFAVLEIPLEQLKRVTKVSSQRIRFEGKNHSITVAPGVYDQRSMAELLAELRARGVSFDPELE